MGGKDLQPTLTSVVSLEEQALLLGETYDLGAVRRVARSDKNLDREVFLVVLAIGSFLLGGLISSSVFAKENYPLRAKMTALGILCGLFVLIVIGCWLLAIARKTKSANVLVWYTSGFAQLLHRAPQPTVVRWSDVITVTMLFFGEESASSGLSQCVLRLRDGTAVRTGRQYGQQLTIDMAQEAALALAPHLVPPLTQAYDAGQPATVSNLTVDRTGITVHGRRGKPAFCPWSAVTRIQMIREGPFRRIQVYRDGAAPAFDIDLDLLVNGIFLPYLIAYAAGANEVKVQGFDRATPESETATLCGTAPLGQGLVTVS